MISQKQFLEKLDAVRCNQSNYQVIVLQNLIPVFKHTMDFEDLVDKLFYANVKNSYDRSHYKMSCPVWKVLGGKKMISPLKNGFRLNTNLDEAGIKAALQILKGKCQE